MLDHDELGLTPWDPGREGAAVLIAAPDGDQVFTWTTSNGRPFSSDVIDEAQKRLGIDPATVAADVVLERGEHRVYVPGLMGAESVEPARDRIRRILAADPRMAPLQLSWGAFLDPHPDRPELTVRLLEDDDLEALSALLNTGDLPPEEVRNIVDVLSRERSWNSIVLVTQSGDTITGVVSAFVDFSWGQMGGLRLLFVSPGHRRAGVGTALVQAAERFAADVGADGISAEVTLPRNGEALPALLERRGWQLVDEHQAMDLRTLRPVPGHRTLHYLRRWSTS